MDILEDLRTTTFSNNEAFFKKAACEIEQLRTENAALKEQVAQLKSSVQHEADCVDSAAGEINRQASENYKLKETIAQQAEAIWLMDDLIESQAASIEHYKSGLTSAIQDIEKYKALCDQMGNALEWYCRQNEDPDSQEILEAWRSMK